MMVMWQACLAFADTRMLHYSTMQLCAIHLCLVQDIMAARTMYDSGALPVLGALKRAPRFRVLAHQRVPAILENISAAIKTALVMPAVGVMACADQVLHDSTHTGKFLPWTQIHFLHAKTRHLL